MPPSGWQGVRRLLAVRLDNIGDVVMLGPALRALREGLPGAQITLMASPAGGSVAPLLPWVDGVLVLSPVWQDARSELPLDPAREQGLVERVRERGFDAAVIFTSFSQSPYPPAYVCYLAGVPLRLGQSKEFGGSLLTEWVKPLPDATHQVDRNLYLLEAAGFASAGRDLELRVSDAARATAGAKLAAAGIDPDAPYIAIAPGATCAARSYRPSGFASVARLLAGETGRPVVLLGSERERATAEAVLAGTAGTPVVSLAGETSVPEFAAVVEFAALVVGNHSGAMHIADAFRRPMVILFSGSDLESQWAPRSAPARLLRRPTDCAPCHQFRCPYQMECLDIPPEEVARAAFDLLERPLPATGEAVACAS